MYYFDDNEYKNYVLNSIRNNLLNQESYLEGLYPIILEEEDFIGNIDDYNQSVIQNDLYEFEYIKNDRSKEYLLNLLMGLEASEGRDDDKTKLKSYLTKLGVLKHYKRAGKNITLKTKQGTKLKADILTEAYPHIAIKFPELTNHHERNGNCHQYVIQIGQYIDNPDCKIVTGYTASTIDNTPFLHSWVECADKKSKKELVIDFTDNLIMPKAQYYKLNKIEPVTTISRAELLDFLDIFNSEAGNRLHGIGSKELLLFYYEIMNTLKEVNHAQNQAILSDTNQSKTNQNDIPQMQ